MFSKDGSLLEAHSLILFWFLVSWFDSKLIQFTKLKRGRGGDHSLVLKWTYMKTLSKPFLVITDKANNREKSARIARKQKCYLKFWLVWSGSGLFLKKKSQLRSEFDRSFVEVVQHASVCCLICWLAFACGRCRTMWTLNLQHSFKYFSLVLCSWHIEWLM